MFRNNNIESTLKEPLCGFCEALCRICLLGKGVPFQFFNEARLAARRSLTSRSVQRHHEMIAGRDRTPFPQAPFPMVF